MNIPRLEQFKYYNVINGETEQFWDRAVFDHQVFEINCYLAEKYTDKIPFPFQRIYTESSGFNTIIVRTDIIPLLWVWYWFSVRIAKSRQILLYALVYLLAEWGLANTKNNYRKPKLSDIKFLGFLEMFKL